LRLSGRCMQLKKPLLRLKGSDARVWRKTKRHHRVIFL
jgi:hypothetical protein